MIDGATPDLQPTNEQQTRMFNEAQVRDVVVREKNAAEEKVRRELQAKYERELAELRQAQSQQGQMGGVQQQVDADKLKGEIYQQVMQQFQQANRNAELERIAGEYLSKTAKGRQIYQDFDAVTAGIDGEAFPNIVVLASKLDNGEEVIYELGQNGLKLEAIESLAMRSPQRAEMELQKLSQSIKLNQSALQNNRKANPPLQGARPSVKAGAGSDTQPMSVKEMRNLPFMK